MTEKRLGLMCNPRNKVLLSRIAALCMIVFVLLPLVSVRSYASMPTRHILYISSFSPDCEFVQSQMRGITSKLDKNTVIKSEFMYGDVVNDSRNEQLFYSTLQYHISSSTIPFDAVIAADDVVLEFAIKYRSILFPDIPLIFAGINNKALADRALSMGNAVGSSVQLNYKENIELACELLPKADSVTAIIDDSPESEALRQQYYQAQSGFDNLSFNEINPAQMTEAEFISQLSELDTTDIVIFVRFAHTSDRYGYTEYEAAKLISDNTNSPVFRLINLDIGNGVLGGLVNSPERYGTAMASAAVSITNGTDPNYIDMSGSLITDCRYDYDVIEKFDLNMSKFPQNSQYVNYRESFKDRYGKPLALGAIAVMLLLVLLQIIFKWFELKIQNRKTHKTMSTMRDMIKLDQKMDKAKTGYINCVSHEIREPLGKLVSISENIKNSDHSDNDMLAEQINEFSDTAYGLRESIVEFLNISNAGPECLSVNKENFKLDKVLNNIHNIYYTLCEDHHVTFEEKRETLENNTLCGDWKKLEIILLSLLSNALHNTSYSEKLILSTACVQADDEFVTLEFSISDAGLGMSKKMYRQLFERKSYYGNGSGVGLAMVRRYTAMLGGELKAESTEGAGSTVKLTVPFETVNESTGAVVKFKAPEEYDFHGKTAIVAEDNELNLAIIKEMLKTVNMNAICVKNGREAVYAFNKAHFDEVHIILMDLNMPVMDGYDTTKTIRKSMHANSATVPIVGMIGHACTSDDIDKMLKSGMDGHIEKPIDADELYSEIERYFTDEETD